MTQGNQPEESQVVSNSLETEVYAPDSMQATNQKRRQLLRGALGVAPVVITLRSGALAASSCTGARLITNLNSESKFTPPPGSTIQPDDYCVIVTSVEGCPSPLHIKEGLKTGYKANPAREGGGVWECNDGQGGTALANQTNVAILSSAAATSLNVI